MNKKISIAVGTAAAVAFTGVAFASDTVTINESEQYVDAPSNFMPTAFLLGDCTAALKGTVGDCNAHGAEMPVMAANGEYWTGGVAIPPTFGGEASGYLNAQAEGAFDNGLFRSDGTSYWTGLVLGWNTIGDAIAEAGTAQGTHPLGGASDGHDFWFDQVTTGYVQTNLDTDSDASNGGEGAVTLAQNMRSSTRFAPGTDLQNVGNIIDQRLEQMVELSSGSNFQGGVPGGPGNPFAFEASRQTIQMAFTRESGPNATTDPTVNEAMGGGGNFPWGELVSQDVEGFFFSCINCDTPALIASGVSHAFTPQDLDARYMEYQSGWNVVPTVIHTGQ